MKGFTVPSGLAAYLRGELGQRGWTNVQLAAKAGLDKSSITYIFNNPNSIPRLDTLAGLANALDVPLVRLIKLCGFEPGEDDGLLDQERIAILLEAVPDLRSVVDSVSQFQPEEIRAILAYIDGLRQRPR